MTTGWGPDHDHHNLADRDHGHDARELAGVAHDDHDHYDYADRHHGHSAYATREELEVEADNLRDELGTVQGRVNELERDRAAMLRRMRLLEDALSLTPPADELTTADPPPFTPTDPRSANG